MNQLINSADFKDIVETKEINPDELVKHVGDGWKPLMSYVRSLPINKCTYFTNKQGCSEMANETVVVHEPKILVGRTALERLRGIETEYTALKKKSNEDGTINKELKDRLASNEHITRRLQEETETLRGSATFYRGKYEETVSKVMRMEDDIGKIRKALGDIRMKEILEGK